jgi:arylsulfatase A-like enzyme
MADRPRGVLPIPERRHVGATTYDAKDPETSFPPIVSLRLNGYSTAQFGKCHEVPVWETSPLGPFDRRPGRGFEHFCGFIGGETTSD